jgi:hypothetical protein
VDLTINVIYIPGTVGALSRFIPLMVHNSPWRFRLVANHCSTSERELLEWYAATSDRLNTYELPGTTEIMPLGKALCALVDLDQDEPFGFMDSDIVLTDNPATTIEDLLAHNEAVFSGTPIWAQPQDLELTDAHGEVAGPHQYTSQGIPLGSSYFGIYQRPTLQHVRTTCRVQPDKYREQDLTTCAPEFHAYLSTNGLVRRDYVPPKVLNLAYAYLGLPITHCMPEGLLHIGGYSMATYSNAQDRLATRSATAAEILDYTDDRHHMARKVAVCQRVMAAFASIDAGQQPERHPTFPQPLQAQVTRIEDLYADLAAQQRHRPPLQASTPL